MDNLLRLSFNRHFYAVGMEWPHGSITVLPNTVPHEQAHTLELSGRRALGINRRELGIRLHPCKAPGQRRPDVS